MRRHYNVVLIPDSEVGKSTVIVPLLPGCVTEDDTREEALANAREAIEVYLEGEHDAPRDLGPLELVRVDLGRAAALSWPAVQ